MESQLVKFFRVLSLWLFWPGVALIIWGELTPHPPDLSGILGWDKAQHFTAYFGLASMTTLVLGLRPRLVLGDPWRDPSGRPAGDPPGLYGPRPRHLDFAANSVGALAGLLVGAVFLLLLRDARLLRRRLRLALLAGSYRAEYPCSKNSRNSRCAAMCMDLAVGVIIGASFTGIVNSLVKDVIMPPIGLALGGVDFSNFFVVLKGDRAVDTLAAATAAKDVTINYGLFVNAVINFLIVAFVLFLLIRQMNKLVAPKPADEAAPAADRGNSAAARNPRQPESPVMPVMKVAPSRLWRPDRWLSPPGARCRLQPTTDMAGGGQWLSMPVYGGFHPSGGIPDAAAGPGWRRIYRLRLNKLLGRRRQAETRFAAKVKIRRP